MIEEKISKNLRKDIISFLSNVDGFKEMQEDELKELASAMKLISLGGGEVLIQEHDNSDMALYILYYGRLRVLAGGDKSKQALIRKDTENEKVIDEIIPGMIVGEISFLIQTPRTRTVRAVRDSVLLKLDQKSFKISEETNNQFLAALALISLNKFTNPKADLSKQNIHTIAVAPAGDSNHLPFIEKLEKELKRIKPTILVTKELCESKFGSWGQIELNDPNNPEVTSWLHQLERQNEFVIYVTDKQMTPWTERCIRQADRVMFIADNATYPSFNSIELSLYELRKKALPRIDLILLQSSETKVITGTDKWLKNRILADYQHLRMNSHKDWSKLRRFLNNRTVGLVLNGGGARALAHLGVLRALEELNIPIDVIGGSSMGALLGALYAHVGLSKTMEFAEKFSYQSNKDFTFPFLSLLKGHTASKVYMECFGDHCIEDLWTRFFCVSTNLTKCKLHINEEGSLWKAIRASTSLPAIYPPLADEQGQIFVDGGVINNMPVDVMREIIGSGTIIAVNSHYNLKNQTRVPPIGAWASGWPMLLNLINPFKKQVLQENIYNVLSTSLNLASNEHQQKMELDSDILVRTDTSMFDLLEFESVKPISEIGYRAAMEQLSKISIHDLLGE